MAAQLPSRRKYNDAVLKPEKCFKDPELQRAQPKLKGNGEPFYMSGQFAIVYKLQCGERPLAFKCWTVDIGNASRIYKEITEHLRAKKEEPSYFITFDYLPDAICIDGEAFPGIKMDWVEGMTLRKFVGENLHKPKQLLELANSFQTMARALHRIEVAHADLQGENIMVTGNNGTSALKLID